MSEIKVGMINWDAGLPEDTFFGRWATNSLGCEKWKHRLPYFAKKEGGGWVFPARAQEDYDRELQYAVDAGIDYFAYCWYTEEETEPVVSGAKMCEAIMPHLHELNRARHLFEGSALNSRIDYCAVILGMHGYSEADWVGLSEAMKKPYYHKIDGRPLVFLYGGCRTDVIERIRSAAARAGFEAFVCFFDNGPKRADGDYSAADAVSVYSQSAKTPVNSYAEFADMVLANNEARKSFGVPLIPEFCTGRSALPRVERPVPWSVNGYRNECPVPENDGSGFPDAARKLKAWMKKNSEWVKSGHVLSFAWNEHEEGGYVCPTLGADGRPNTTRLENYKKAVAILKGQAE